MERWGAARRASALEEQHHGGLEEGPGISLRDTERNTMATPAIIGITRPQGGWDGSYVHYDGDPASGLFGSSFGSCLSLRLPPQSYSRHDQRA